MNLNHTSDYAKRRKESYPSVEEQLDMLFHLGFDKWKAEIAAVKARFPKPAVVPDNKKV